MICSFDIHSSQRHKETACIVSASLQRDVALLSHCYHIFKTREHNEDNDMHMKKCSDWLSYGTIETNNNG